MAAKFPFQIVDGTGQIGIGGIGTHDPYGLHGVKPQSSGKYIGCIAKFIHDAQNLFTGTLADIGIAV